MSDTINLLKNKEKQVADKSTAKKLKILRYVSLTILFLVSMSAMTLFFLIAFSPLPALQKQESEELVNIRTYHTKIARLSLIQERMQGIRNFLKVRPAYDKVLDSVISKIPENVLMDEIHISERTVTLSVISQSLLPLNQFSTEVVSLVRSEKLIKKVSMKNITTDVDQKTFRMSLNLTLL